MCATFVLGCTPLFALYAPVCVTFFDVVRPCLRHTPLFALYAPVCVIWFWVVRPCFRCTPPHALSAPFGVELLVRSL